MELQECDIGCTSWGRTEAKMMVMTSIKAVKTVVWNRMWSVTATDNFLFTFTMRIHTGKSFRVCPDLVSFI